MRIVTTIITSTKNMKAKKEMKIKKKNKKEYQIRNWSAYNEALKQRGNIEVWMSEEAIEKWKALPTKKKGAQGIYSNLAIETALRLGKVFHQRLRQTEGMLRSIFSLMHLVLPVPDYSTLSRRGDGNQLNVELYKEKKENVYFIIDSTGLKVYGEGEWKVRKYGYSKHRTWRKLHIVIDKDHEIRAVELTENNITDSDAVEDVMKQEESAIEAVAGDGAYDKLKVYTKCEQKNIQKILIPPQKNAKIIRHGNNNAHPHPRDENLRWIRKTSRKKWKEASGYHVRSLSETGMFRIKTIFGEKLNAQKIENQKTKARIICSALNIMTALGMPQSYIKL